MLGLRAELEDIKAQWENAHKVWESDPLVQQLREVERALQVGAECAAGSATPEAAEEAQPPQMECDLNGKHFQAANAKAEAKKLSLSQEREQLQRCLEEGSGFITENQETVARLQSHVADQRAHLEHQLCPPCLEQYASQPPQVQA